MRTRALVRGALVLRSQTRSEGGGVYRSWSEAIRWLSLLAGPNDAEAAVLKGIAPDIADLLGRPIHDPPELPPEAAQFRLYAVVGGLLRRHAQSAAEPLVLILEDLQWMGSESLSLLSHVTGLVEDLPLLVLGAYRDDERPDLPASLRAMRAIKLDRFDAPDMAALAESMLGPAGRQENVLALLKRETEGNAFFVVEVLRALAEESRQLADIGRKPLPEAVAVGGVEQILQRRLERVPAEARPLLEMAAVAGRWLDMGVISHALNGGRRDPVLEARLARSLVDCADAAVFDVQNGRWCFAHDRLRERVLAGLRPDRAHTLHRKVAEAIEALIDNPTEQARALAHHWQQAGDPTKEAYYNMAAGLQLLETSAYAEARALMERALARTLALAGGSALGGSLTLTAQEILLRGRIGQACIGLADYAAAQEHYATLLALCETHGQWEGVALAQRGLGEISDSQGDYPSAQGRFEESLAICRRIDDPRGLAETWHRLGRIAEKTGDYARAVDYQQKALALCRDTAAPEMQQTSADALRALGNTYMMLGEAEKAVQSWQESLAIARELGNRRAIAGCLNNLGIAAENRADLAEARRYYAESLAIKREIGDRRGAAASMVNLGLVHYDGGEYPAGKAILAEALAICEALGDRQGVADALNNTGLCDLAMGQFDAACDAFQQSLALCRELGDRWGVALALLNIAKTRRDEGNLPQAHLGFAEAIRAAQEIGHVATLLETLLEYALLLNKEHRREEAAALLAVVAAHPKVTGRVRARAEAALAGASKSFSAERIGLLMEEARSRELDEVIASLTLS